MPSIRLRSLAVLGSLTVALLLVSACSSDAGADVRSSSGSASAGSGSSSGLAAEDLSGGTDDPLVQTGGTSYREYVLAEVAQLRLDTKVFTDAVRAGDLEAAKAAYAPSRVRWERIEPIAGLVEEIDGKVDARVDDFAGVADPEFTGWRRIELIFFEQGTTEGAAGFADQLDADLATLEQQIQTLEIPPRAVALGAVSSSKRCRGARSPVRRIATPASTCGTSRRTSTDPQRWSMRCDPRCKSATRRC